MFTFTTDRCYIIIPCISITSSWVCVETDRRWTSKCPAAVGNAVTRWHAPSFKLIYQRCSNPLTCFFICHMCGLCAEGFWFTKFEEGGISRNYNKYHTWFYPQIINKGNSPYLGNAVWAKATKSISVIRWMIPDRVLDSANVRTVLHPSDEVFAQCKRHRWSYLHPETSWSISPHPSLPRRKFPGKKGSLGHNLHQKIRYNNIAKCMQHLAIYAQTTIINIQAFSVYIYQARSYSILLINVQDIEKYRSAVNRDYTAIPKARYVSLRTNALPLKYTKTR